MTKSAEKFALRLSDPVRAGLIRAERDWPTPSSLLGRLTSIARAEIAHAAKGG